MLAPLSSFNSPPSLPPFTSIFSHALVRRVFIPLLTTPTSTGTLADVRELLKRFRLQVLILYTHAISLFKTAFIHNLNPLFLTFAQLFHP